MPGEVGAAAHAAWPTAVLGVCRHCAGAHRLAFRLVHITVRNESPKMRLPGVVVRPRPAGICVAVIPAGRQVYAVVADDLHKIRIAHHVAFRIEE